MMGVRCQSYYVVTAIFILGILIRVFNPPHLIVHDHHVQESFTLQPS